MNFDLQGFACTIDLLSRLRINVGDFYGLFIRYFYRAHFNSRVKYKFYLLRVNTEKKYITTYACSCLSPDPDAVEHCSLCKCYMQN